MALEALICGGFAPAWGSKTDHFASTMRGSRLVLAASFVLGFRVRVHQRFDGRTQLLSGESRDRLHPSYELQ